MAYFYQFIISNWQHIKMYCKWKKINKMHDCCDDLKRTVTNGYSAPTISVT